MSFLDDRVREAETALGRSGTRRTPNERALDQQHALVAALERVVELYAKRGAHASQPAQRVAGVLRLERERTRMLRHRVDRERGRPGG